jgi:hypothetical protein
VLRASSRAFDLRSIDKQANLLLKRLRVLQHLIANLLRNLPLDPVTAKTVALPVPGLQHPTAALTIPAVTRLPGDLAQQRVLYLRRASATEILVLNAIF